MKKEKVRARMKKKKVRARMKKKKKVRARMKEAASGFGSLSDCLVANIFGRLTVEEKLLTIPIVCRRWNRVSRGALCWQSIDLDGVWSDKQAWDDKHSSTVERIIEMLVTRSDGCLLSFYMSYLPSDACLRLVAQRGQALQRLKIPGSKITDECVRQVAPLLPSITYLDICGCKFLSQTGLEALGQHCKCLTNLEVSSNDEECLAIAHHMPQLKHLRFHEGESRKGLQGKSMEGLQALLDSCTALEVLDLEGSTIYMNEALLEKYKSRNIEVVWSFTKWKNACDMFWFLAGITP